jgi:hypothetical protein
MRIRIRWLVEDLASRSELDEAAKCGWGHEIIMDRKLKLFCSEIEVNSTK